MMMVTQHQYWPLVFDHRDVDIVRLLLEQDDVDVNLQHKEGTTVLIDACWNLSKYSWRLGSKIYSLELNEIQNQ